MGPGPDGPMGAMGAMEPHHMNGSLGWLRCLKGTRQCFSLEKANFDLPLPPQGLGTWTGCQR